MTHSDVYEESEADLASERNNNRNNRSTKSRSPDIYYVKVTKSDRKISSRFSIIFFTQKKKKQKSKFSRFEQHQLLFILSLSF